MPINVKPLTVPPAGVDTVEITIEESYDVQGVGSDTVSLTGTLVAHRAPPLLGPGARTISWKTSTVVAQFTDLKLSGKSDIFGSVKVTLDKSMPAYGVVTGGKCAAALGVVVSMPRIGMKLRTAEPMQLQSTVKTVPPIGDEKTVSVAAVDLVDVDTNRKRGSLMKARVIWRTLVQQVRYPIA